MSDNTTLVERLRSYNTPGIKMEAAARIAELEAEVARLVETNGYVNDANARLVGVRDARIAELEAEVARLQEALRLKYGDTIRAAVLAERAACAQAADTISRQQSNDYDDVGFEIACDGVAAAIRARP